MTATEPRSPREGDSWAQAMQRLNAKPYYTRIALLGIAMYLFIEAVILIVTLIFEPSDGRTRALSAALPGPSERSSTSYVRGA